MTFVCGPSAIAVQHADEAASLRSIHMALQRFRYDLISWRCGLLGVLPAALSGHLLERCSLPAIGWMLLDATGIFRFHSTDQLVGAGAVNGPAVSSSCWTWTKNTLVSEFWSSYIVCGEEVSTSIYQTVSFHSCHNRVPAPLAEKSAVNCKPRSCTHFKSCFAIPCHG